MAQGIVEQPNQSAAEQQAGQTKAPGANRSQLVQRLLDHTSNLPAFLHDLLTTQAVTVAGTEAAGFLIERGEKGPALRPIAHIRPDNSPAETRQAALQAFMDIVRPCVQQGKDGAIEVGAPNDAHEAQFCLVTLLRSDGEVVAVSAVITRCINVERARQRLMSMQLVAGYFELFTLRRTSEQNKLIAQSHQHVLQLASSVATADGFEAAAQSLCNELATRCHAARVSLGWLKGKNVKVKALSHTEQFDKKQELIVQLEKAMEECLDQEEVVQYDPNPNGGQSTNNVTRAHAALSRAQGGQGVLSLPLRRKGGDIAGVVTLEFAPTQQLGPQVAQGVNVAVELLAPQLYDRYQNDRWLITKAGISTRELGKKIIGPRHTLAKVVVALILIAVLVLFNIPYQLTGLSWLDASMKYRVAAPFQFVPEGRRVVSAPFDGKLWEIGQVNGQPIRPGAQVKKGDVLAKMDTKELELQYNQAAYEVARLAAEINKYRADPERRAEVLVAEKEREAQLAKAQYYKHQIDKGTLVAPVDGVVLAGDLLHKVGDMFSPRDVMFEIGPVNDLKVELSVAERDIQDLKVGQPGKIATSSLPSEKWPIKVDRIVPMSKPEEGDNVFKVYATLEKTDPNWRPGMAGEARVEVRDEEIAWIWTHRLVDFVRLKLWLPF